MENRLNGVRNESREISEKIVLVFLLWDDGDLVYGGSNESVEKWLDFLYI